MDISRILLVEDEAIIAMLYHVQLRHLGHEVWRHVTTGEEAVDLAERERPDLVLVDIHLAGKMDGIEAAQKISAMAGAPVPIIFISGYSSQEVRGRAARLQPVAFLEKPVSLEMLKGVLERVVGNPKPASAPNA